MGHLTMKKDFIVKTAKKLSFVVIAALIIYLIQFLTEKPPLFKDISGPEKVSVIQDSEPTPIQQFSTNLPSSLAILLTDTNSNWLPLAHGLKAIGIPFTITESTEEALQHNVVLVYPLISGKVLSRDALQSLRTYVHKGGTLLAVNVLGGGLGPVFGFKEVTPSFTRHYVNFQEEAKTMFSFHDSREASFRLGQPEKGNAIGSYGYNSLTSPPLAKFEDGTGAIIGRDFELGHAYAFGFDIGQLIHIGYSNRGESIARDYVNAYEPTIDIVLRLIRAIYLRDEPEAVLLGTVPFGKALTVLVTHDIDYSRSVKNALDYARLENQYGIPATYFLQTKFVKDYNDITFFNPENMKDISSLVDLGMEVGGHSVAHSRQFAQFPMGTGQETYPHYQPFVKNLESTSGGTILGELRVSKFLIECCTGEDQVVSFRPGVLSNPDTLPQALQATGYRFSSSVTANNSLTHLPFQLTTDRRSRSETPIFEFPVTIEDEESPPMDQRLGEALTLAEKISTYGGMFNILIHPDVLGEKIEFLKGFLNEWKDRAWFGSMQEFGSWWSVRNNIRLTSNIKGRQASLTLRFSDSINGLTLQAPATWRMVSVEPNTIKATQTDTIIVIESAHETLTINFDRSVSKKSIH
jgi:peptidoglycan/xylan/chitin deacetylase (PgdA/CDA1 family)